MNPRGSLKEMNSNTHSHVLRSSNGSLSLPRSLAEIAVFVRPPVEGCLFEQLCPQRTRSRFLRFHVTRLRAALRPTAVTLLESADPQNKRVTHLESALPNSLDLKSFIIRTYKKRRGVG